MNVFIAQKMNGLSDEEIESVRQKTIEHVKRIYGEDVTFLDQFHLPDDVPDDVPSDRVRLHYLGRSIQILAKADIVVFAGDCSDAKGCLVETAVCSIYDIPYLVFKGEDK